MPPTSWSTPGKIAPAWNLTSMPTQDCRAMTAWRARGCSHDYSQPKPGWRGRSRSPAEPRQSGNNPGHTGKPLPLVGPDALQDHAVVGPELDERRVFLDPADQPLGSRELVLMEREDDGLLAGVDLLDV